MSLVKECFKKYLFQEYYQELGRMLPCLDVEYAIIKGEVLSKMAYFIEGKRNGTDIDILIPKKAVKRVEACLKDFGFQTRIDNRFAQILLLSSSHQTRTWYKECGVGIMTIDLNFDIFWGEYQGKRVDMSEFLIDSVDMDIYGVKVKSLTPIKAFIQLALHHYKDMNSIYLLATRNSVNYDMFKDIYYLLINNVDSIELDKLLWLSETLEITPYVYYILYYTGLIYNDAILRKYISAFESEEGDMLLDIYGLCEDEKKKWKYDFETRLKTDNMLKLIQSDLNDNDIRKIKTNKSIFNL